MTVFIHFDLLYFLFHCYGFLSCLGFSYLVILFDWKWSLKVSSYKNISLLQAKKFVESAPAIVKADISKSEAEKLKEILVKVGADVEITS